MQRADVRARLGDALAEIAPEVDLDAIPGDADLAESADLDSMDLLNLMAAIDASLGVSIPERDYPQLRTLDGMVDYLAARVAA
jgi:acyl carrier protein